MGPIILCLDTSGSMRGARELVAKALALECMRGAHRQQRPCYLYAFSGPGKQLPILVLAAARDKNSALQLQQAMRKIHCFVVDYSVLDACMAHEKFTDS